MGRTDITINCTDGDCRSWVFRPEGKGAGPWPAALFFMDAPAIRQTLFDWCQRIANEGYVVLLPDLFYRAGAYDYPLNMRGAFTDPEARQAFFTKYMGSTSPQKVAADTKYYLDYLDAQSDVKKGKIGVSGYCMGGSMALVTAGTYPDRVAAVGSFHGTRMATESKNSPHLIAPKVKAKVLIASADKDAGFPPEQADTLRAALNGAGVNSRVEIWDGALHGWTMADNANAYNQAAAERHFTELMTLYRETLQAG